MGHAACPAQCLWLLVRLRPYGFHVSYHQAHHAANKICFDRCSCHNGLCPHKVRFSRCIHWRLEFKDRDQGDRPVHMLLSGRGCAHPEEDLLKFDAHEATSIDWALCLWAFPRKQLVVCASLWPSLPWPFTALCMLCFSLSCHVAMLIGPRSHQQISLLPSQG